MDIGKPNILIILPIYLMYEKREPFTYQNETDEKLEMISIYTLMYKFYIYNKLLVAKFENDVYWSTIIEKQREKLAANDLGVSEYFILLMRMFKELEDLILQGKAQDFESLVAFTLIRKEKEFSDIRDDDDKGTIWMLKISEIFKNAKSIIQANFEDYWNNSGFTKSELTAWLSGGSENLSAAQTDIIDNNSSGYHFPYAVTLVEAMAKIDELKEKSTSMGDWIDIRHMLTDNIRRNLIEGANKDEGRQAYVVRTAFDNTMFDLRESDLNPGPTGKSGLEEFKSAIQMENASEQLEILEKAVSLSRFNAHSLKFELLKIVNDEDRIRWFSPQCVEMIKAAAKTSFLESICEALSLNRVSFNLAKKKVDDISRIILAIT